MADNNYLDDETDNENEADQEKKPFAFTRTTLILVAALAVSLVALSITATLLVVHMLKPDPAPVVAAVDGVEQPASENADGTTDAESATDESAIDGQGEPLAAEAAQEPPKAKKQPAIYYPLNPPIIVNFDARGRQRFLQAEVALMTRDHDVVDAIELHMSMIRNNLILLIGSHLYEELQTAEGKELLRQQCLQELQRVMEQEIGKPGIEQVLFTNFVMQ